MYYLEILENIIKLGKKEQSIILKHDDMSRQKYTIIHWPWSQGAWVQVPAKSPNSFVTSGISLNLPLQPEVV